MGDTRHIETASSNVGGDDDVQTTILQRLNHALTLILGDVAVQRSSLVTLGFQRSGQVQSGLFGAYKTDQCVELFDFQQAQDSRVLLVSVDHQVRLLNRSHGLGLRSDFDVLRVAQVFFCDGADRVRQGRGEQYALTAGRHGFEDHFEVIHKAQFEHFVRFVEHQVLNGRQDFLVTTQVVNQTTRRGHDDLCTLTDSLQLRTHRCAAVNGNHVEARHLLGIGFKGGGHLQGQLAGWRKDQRLWLFLGRVDFRQDRQRKSSGFTGTGLGLTDHVLTGQNYGNGLRLNRRRLFVTNSGQCSENIGVESECGEAAGFLGHGSASSASAKTHVPKLRMPCKTRESPWQPCRRGFAKTCDK